MQISGVCDAKKERNKQTLSNMDERNYAGSSLELNYINTPYFVICFCGFILHSLLLYVFFKDPLKCFRNSGTILVINVAVSDFMTCLICPFYLSVKDIGWSKTLRFLVYTTANVSIETISLISFDRFLLVAYPMKHRYLTKGRKILICLASIWLGSFVFPAKQVIYREQQYDQLVLNCFGVTLILVSAVMYTLTYFKLKKQSQNIQALQNSVESRAQELRIRKEKQFLRTILIIACIAFTCIVPSTLISTFSMYIQPSTTRIFVIIAYCMVYINYSINPLVYILRLPNYRKSFYLLYCKRG